MRQDENRNYIPTAQQRKMIKAAGRHWTKDHQPDLLDLLFIWSVEVSLKIPIISIIEVYDYLIETGYYNPECL